MISKKVLVLVQGKEARGGVNTYFSALRKHFVLQVDYIYRGSRHYPEQDSRLLLLVRLFYDFVKFFFYCIFGRYSLVHINSTLDKRSILRDSFYILLSRMLRKKIIVFYRAWDKSFEKLIEKRYMKIFSKIFFLPQASVVLGTEFQQLLRKWGHKKPIYVESTTVESDLLNGFDIASLIEKRLNRAQIFNILFLSRLEYKKGIFICADAYNILKQKYPNTRLIFGGDGTDFEKLKDYVINNGIKDVVFLGYLTKEKKCQSFADASVFILPTYGEGLPNAVLEAMAFGLPIITRQVGGLPDIIFNEENGFITNSYAPDFFAKCMERLIEDKNLYSKISKNNYQIASTKFLSNVVAKRIENIYLEVLK